MNLPNTDTNTDTNTNAPASGCAKKKKLTHNYTSELELKSLLIRIKNKKLQIILDEKLNTRINKYIKWHTKISSNRYESSSKRRAILHKLKDAIVRDSEISAIDNTSYERFGEIILLMIKNILKKPQFSGYTYRNDFYSDAVYKILKYLHNFNHKLISKRTNQQINAFAYISQIIHNSILFIINYKKKESDLLKRQVEIANLDHNLQLKYFQFINDREYDEPEVRKIETVHLKEIKTNLVHELLQLSETIDKVDRLDLYYPSDYRISLSEYDELKNLLKGKVSIMRENDEI
jgi:hypothetical protein